MSTYTVRLSAGEFSALDRAVREVLAVPMMFADVDRDGLKEAKKALDRAFAREKKRQEKAEKARVETLDDVRAILEATNTPLLRADDPPSSRLAAFDILDHQPKLRLDLFFVALWRERKGLRYASDHLGRHLGLVPDQFSSQVSQMKKAGLLEETGVMINTVRGKPAMELRVPPKILEALGDQISP